MVGVMAWSPSLAAGSATLLLLTTTAVMMSTYWCQFCITNRCLRLSNVLIVVRSAACMSSLWCINIILLRLLLREKGRETNRLCTEGNDSPFVTVTDGSQSDVMSRHSRLRTMMMSSSSWTTCNHNHVLVRGTRVVINYCRTPRLPLIPLSLSLLRVVRVE
jgi:hypothetical protein